MRRTMFISAVTVLACSASTAIAGISTIGEFTGDASEYFENIIPPGSNPGPMPIFGGQGTLNDAITNSPWIVTNVFGGSGEEIFPQQGTLAGMTVTGWTTITLDTPATQFGGYFATGNGPPLPGSVRFYDDNDQEVGSVSFEPEAWNWNWHGWESATPFSRIEIQSSDASPGLLSVYDSLQVTFVPAPAAASLLVLAGGLARRRRRA